MEIASCSILKLHSFSSSLNNGNQYYYETLPRVATVTRSSFHWGISLTSVSPINYSCAGKRLHLIGCATSTSTSQNPSPEFAVLLEVDGVLIDSHRLGNLQAFNAAFKTLGLDCANWTKPIYVDLVRKSGGDEKMMLVLFFNRIGWPSSLPTSERGTFVERCLKEKVGIHAPSFKWASLSDVYSSSQSLILDEEEVDLALAALDLGFWRIDVDMILARLISRPIWTFAYCLEATGHTIYGTGVSSEPAYSRLKMAQLCRRNHVKIPYGSRVIQRRSFGSEENLGRHATGPAARARPSRARLRARPTRAHLRARPSRARMRAKHWIPCGLEWPAVHPCATADSVRPRVSVVHLPSAQAQRQPSARPLQQPSASPSPSARPCLPRPIRRPFASQQLIFYFN